MAGMGEVIRIGGFSAVEGLTQVLEELHEYEMDDTGMVVLTNDYCWYLGDQDNAVRDAIFLMEVWRQQLVRPDDD